MPRLRDSAVVAALAFGFAVLFTYPMWMAWSAVPLANDWDGHLQIYGAAAQTLAKYGQLPVWNPWECGGSPLLANPESHVATPFLFLEAALGVVSGVKVEIILHLALMVMGGYLLGRELGLGRLAAWVPAIVPAWSSSYPLHIGTGHLWAFGYAYVPWVLWLGERAVRRHSTVSAALSGAALAVMANEGATYPAPHAALLLSALMLWRAASARSIWPLLVLGIAGVSAFLLGAPHLLPIYSLMRNHPRTLPSAESTGWSVVARAFFSLNQDRAQALPRDRWYWGFQEYGAYLGPIGGLLALVGIVRGGREARPWLAIAALFLCLGLGDFGSPSVHVPLSPWAALHRLPGFASLRVPGRFFTMVSIELGLLGGLGLQSLVSRFGMRAQVVGILALGVGAADAWVRGPPNLAVMYSLPARDIPPTPTFTQYLLREPRQPTQYASLLTRANYGALNCWDEIHLPVGALGANQPGYQGEQVLKGPGHVSLLTWSPNRLAFHLELPAPTDLLINENYDSPWRLAAGQGEVFADRGRIGVHLSAGTQNLTLEYRSTFVSAGLALFAVGLALIAGLAVFDRRTKRPIATP